MPRGLYHHYHVVSQVDDRYAGQSVGMCQALSEATAVPTLGINQDTWPWAPEQAEAEGGSLGGEGVVFA